MAQIKPIEKQVDELVKKLSIIKEKEIDRGVARALNRTLRAGRTEAAKEIRQRTKLPSAIIKKRMYERKATSKKQSAFLYLYYRGVAAISLPGVRDTGRYVKGRRGRQGRGVRARGGFHYRDSWITDSKTKSGLQVFTETIAKPGSDKKYELEVERVELRPHFDEIGQRVLDRQMQNHFPQRLRAELNYRLNKYKAKK
ncbi:phage tail protein [Marinobacterium stanieri]|uniref:phage tail protein n=1 Tax=Marinobacterium stanieri TaxID=49186 RepID=UPI003A903E1D